MKIRSGITLVLMIMGFVGAVRAALSVEWFEPNDSYGLKVNIHKGLLAELTLKNLEVLYTLNGVTKSLTHITSLFNGKMFIQVEDYNFDGFVDLNVFSGYGYMGLNQYSQIFIFDHSKQAYVFAIQGSNLEKDNQQNELWGFEKVGQQSIRRHYKVNNDKIYLYEESKPSGECEQEIKRFLPGGNIDSVTTSREFCQDE